MSLQGKEVKLKYFIYMYELRRNSVALAPKKIIGQVLNYEIPLDLIID